MIDDAKVDAAFAMARDRLTDTELQALGWRITALFRQRERHERHDDHKRRMEEFVNRQVEAGVPRDLNEPWRPPASPPWRIGGAGSGHEWQRRALAFLRDQPGPVTAEAIAIAMGTPARGGKIRLAALEKDGHVTRVDAGFILTESTREAYTGPFGQMPLHDVALFAAPGDRFYAVDSAYYDEGFAERRPEHGGLIHFNDGEKRVLYANERDAIHRAVRIACRPLTPHREPHLGIVRRVIVNDDGRGVHDDPDYQPERFSGWTPRHAGWGYFEDGRDAVGVFLARLEEPSTEQVRQLLEAGEIGRPWPKAGPTAV